MGQFSPSNRSCAAVIVTRQIATATNGFWDAGTGGACSHFHNWQDSTPAFFNWWRAEWIPSFVTNGHRLQWRPFHVSLSTTLSCRNKAFHSSFGTASHCWMWTKILQNYRAEVCYGFMLDILGLFSRVWIVVSLLVITDLHCELSTQEWRMPMSLLTVSPSWTGSYQIRGLGPLVWRAYLIHIALDYY